MVDVVLVVGSTVVGNAELSVGGLGSTVTVGEIVNDNLDDLLLAGAVLDLLGVSKIGTEIGDLGDRVEPGEGGIFATEAALALSEESEMAAAAAAISSA